VSSSPVGQPSKPPVSKIHWNRGIYQVFIAIYRGVDKESEVGCCGRKELRVGMTK
jgi:hypothetical protein